MSNANGVQISCLVQKGDMLMKNLGMALAVGLTAVIVIMIGLFNFLLRSEAAPIVDNSDPLTGPEATAAPDLTAVRAAYDAREALLEAQIFELDAELADRQAAYELQVGDLTASIVSREEQLAELLDQETAMQEQVELLLDAQAEHVLNGESQRQQASYQYQINIQQLQAQLDEAQSKLNEALVRLGQ